MPRKYLRSVDSSYELEDKKPATSMDIADDLNDDRFADYDEDEFYLRATDHQGHCKNIQITIPTNFAPSIQRIIESDRNPFKNAAEMARDAMVHAIVKHIRALGLEDDPEVADWFLDIELGRVEAEQRARLSYLENLERTCELMIQTMDWVTLHRTLFAASQLEWPKGLATKRDEIVRRYREKFPPNFNPHYAAYMDI